MPRSTTRTSGHSKGGSHRTFAGRPCTPGKQAPHHRRPLRNPTRRLSDQRKPSRRHPAHAAAGQDSPHPGPARPATPPAPATVRRPQLRLRQVPPPGPGSRDHTERSPAAGPRTAPAWTRPAGWSSVPSPGSTSSNDSAFATSYAPPPRSTPTRLQHHLLETTPNLILKRSVRDPVRWKDPGVFVHR